MLVMIYNSELALETLSAAGRPFKPEGTCSSNDTIEFIRNNKLFLFHPLPPPAAPYLNQITAYVIIRASLFVEGM